MTPAERERYSRQIAFSPLGEDGQSRIRNSSVVIVGCGALGCVLAGALVRAGVGRARIVDRDYVELSNLQRQWLFEESDAAQALPKAVAAARRLGLINSTVQVDGVVSDLTALNADELLGESDLILDGTDNFETRYLMNEYAVREGVPWIYGAAVGSYGLTMSVAPGETACLQCLYPTPPLGPQPTCETAGVLGPLPSVIASLQASEALKILAGHASSSKITTVDTWTGEIRQIAQPGPDPTCEACGARKFPRLDGTMRAPVSLCGRNAVQIHERKRPVNLAELAATLRPLGTVRSNDFALQFETPPYLLTVFPDGRVIVKGTTEPGIARSLYARYLGG